MEVDRGRQLERERARVEGLQEQSRELLNQTAKLEREIADVQTSNQSLESKLAKMVQVGAKKNVGAKVLTDCRPGLQS